MLIIYTTDECNTEDVNFINRHADYFEVGENLSWCRELTSSKIRYISMTESFSVYGVVDGRGSYRPDIEPIRDHGPAIGELVNLVFHTTLGLASRLVLGTGASVYTCQTAWSCMRERAPLTESTIDMSNWRDVGIGSVRNLPAWVGKSIALTSFLLYLPRIWYNLAQMQYTRDQQYTKINSAPALLNIMAGYLAVPLYQMPQGGAGFWSFLDFLITASTLETLEAKALLLDNDGCDGYNSWINRLRDDCPEWCRPIVERNTLYNKYGATAMVNPKTRKGTL